LVSLQEYDTLVKTITKLEEEQVRQQAPMQLHGCAAVV
jgi:hypothetical protein